MPATKAHCRCLLLIFPTASGILALTMIRQCVLWVPAHEMLDSQTSSVQRLGRARLDLVGGTLWILEGPETTWPSSLPGEMLVCRRISGPRWTHPGVEERLVVLPGELVQVLIQQLRAGRTFLPPPVQKVLMEGEHPSARAWVRVQRIVQFVDVVGFTTLTRMLPPARIQRFLQVVYDRFSQTVYRHGGEVSKYMGDALLVCYPEDHADAAFQASVDMLGVCREVRRERAEDPEFRWLHVGIGLACGEVLEGPLGGQTFQEWAHIGDPVNTSARLQALTRRLPWWIITTRTLARRVRQSWPWVPLGTYRPDHPDHPVDVVALGVSLARQSDTPEAIRHHLERALRTPLLRKESGHER